MYQILISVLKLINNNLTILSMIVYVLSFAILLGLSVFNFNKSDEIKREQIRRTILIEAIPTIDMRLTNLEKEMEMLIHNFSHVTRSEREKDILVVNQLTEEINSLKVELMKVKTSEDN